MSDLTTPWATEALAHELLEALSVPAWLHMPERPLHANAALRRLCGLAPEDLATTPHLSLVVPADRDALAAATDECLDGSGEPPAQSMQILTRNGTERPVELTLRRVQPGGRPAVLVTCVDLTDFQHVQSMMFSMGSMLRQIVDGAPVAVYVLDREHRVTHWNSACERLTGREADEMVGCTEHWRAFGDSPRTQLADLLIDGVDPLGAALDLGGVVQPSALVAGAYEQEVFLAEPAPEGRWLHFTVAPLRDMAGASTGAIVTLQDVSQRRRTEDELTRRLERMVAARSAELAGHARMMDAFVDNAPMGVVQADRHRVRRSNRRMAEIFGPAPPQGNGLDAREFYLDAEDLAVLQRAAHHRLNLGEPVHHEMWMHHADGRKLWVQLNAFRVDMADPDLATWWMVQDRTEVRTAQEALHQRFEELQATNQKLEQAQNQLLQQDKMASIGQLAAGVAHEINNPVGFVSSNLHTLRQYVESLLSLVDAQARAGAAPGDAALQAELRRIEDQVELDYLKEDLPQLLDESADGLARVKKIVQDLKDFSRVDQSDWQQTDLNAGLESTLNVVRNEVKYKAEVVKQLGTLPLVTCLAGQLNQVFMNLIVNASHAIAERGTITLSSGAQHGWAWVQVNDSGCGMTEEVRRRVFEPFFTTKEVGKGTGLGLSLSFSIIKRHGGQIQVRSTPGLGSAFRVWVPVGGPQAPGTGSTSAEPPAWPGEG